MEVFVIRLLPGDNLQEKLVEFVKEKRLQNAFVITCVGSLTSAKIRLANADLTRDFSGHFEIVSLVGTIDPDGEHHLHISISDDKGNVFGGHVFSDHIVYTTAEIVIGSAQGLSFSREHCQKSGWPELVVKKN